ncbi:MAG: hypothetical protein FK733_01665 [Asgard group archaeon]|nr:hypothetical protein [Asgard group archaeon]
MSRARTSKESDFSEENLVGKSIVDPKGNIVAKCIALIEDDKKKVHMRIAITTDIGSEFVVEELIPVSSISKIGEVILLKKATEIKPVAIEDIVSFEIPELQTIEESNDNKQSNDNSTSSDKSNILTASESYLPSDELKTVSKKDFDIEKYDKIVDVSLIDELNEIANSKNGIRPSKIRKFVSDINTKASRRKTAIKSILNQFSESEIPKRLAASEILIELSEINASSLIPSFKQGLIHTYNEPSKEVEGNLLKYLIKVASQNNKMFAKLKLNKFFEKLIIKRDICKPITMNRIHNINLKIFVNNFETQEIIISNYLKIITKKTKKSDVFSLLLKDYNAILIAYSLIRTFKENNWSEFLNSNNIKKVFDEPFRNSIDRIIQNFLEGNIKALSEIIDPKLGFNYSNKIITNMIKFRLDDFLSNVSILPLDVLTAFFQDDEKRAVKIIFDLINRNEINAQIVFIEDKTYISFRDG